MSHVAAPRQGATHKTRLEVIQIQTRCQTESPISGTCLYVTNNPTTNYGRQEKSKARVVSFELLS